MFICSTRKALRLSVFFIAAAVFSGSIFFSGLVFAGCSVKKYNEAVRVLRVTDGDTVVLTDKRKIRLIGINTPELAHYPKPAEAFSLQAKRFVEASIRPNKNVYLKYGAERKDHYGRVLAHLFLNDGRNLNAMLVENGLASAVVFPPNLNLVDCYFRAERKAKNNRRNIWAHAYGQYRDANKVAKKGYAFIKGNVIRVGRSRDSVWLQLATKFTVRIKKRDFKYFPGLDLKKITTEQLKNKKIYLRGWVYKWKRSFYVQARHAYMMQVLAK